MYLFSSASWEMYSPTNRPTPITRLVVIQLGQYSWHVSTTVCLYQPLRHYKPIVCTMGKNQSCKVIKYRLERFSHPDADGAAARGRTCFIYDNNLHLVFSILESLLRRVNYISLRQNGHRYLPNIYIGL